ncbi:MAG: hypothetical protein OXH52_10270 [Gammaproteobacteria bacterium]|nr:hypothetical protein [Gammaproteobacteria bacterium]
MDDQIPGRVEPRFRRLGLPELQIERAIQFFKFSVAFNDAPAHPKRIPDGQASSSWSNRPSSDVTAPATRDNQAASLWAAVVRLLGISLRFACFLFRQDAHEPRSTILALSTLP